MFQYFVYLCRFPDKDIIIMSKSFGKKSWFNWKCYLYIIYEVIFSLIWEVFYDAFYLFGYKGYCSLIGPQPQVWTANDITQKGRSDLNYSFSFYFFIFCFLTIKSILMFLSFKAFFNKSKWQIEFCIWIVDI